MDKSQDPTKVIVVLGMHRAGTSLCARMLHELGADFGENLLSARADNPEGLWEHAEIMRHSHEINAQLNRRLASPTGPLPFRARWLDMPDIVERKRAMSQVLAAEIARTRSVFAFKDPNTLRILPLWQAIFAELGIEPRYITTVRSPRATARSLLARDRINLAQGELLWAVHYADGIRHLRGELNCVVRFDEWFSQPQRQAERLLAGLGFALPGGRAPADVDAGAVQRELRHHRPEQSADNAYARRLYEALLEAAEKGVDPAQLVAATHPLEEAMQALAPLARTLERASSGNTRRVLRRYEAEGWVPRDWPPPALELELDPASAAAAHAGGPSRSIGVVMPPRELAPAPGVLSHEDLGFLELAVALAEGGHKVSVYFVEGARGAATAKQYLAGRGASAIEVTSLEMGAVPCMTPGGNAPVAAAARAAYIAYQGLRDVNLDVIHFPDYKAPSYFVLCAKRSRLNFQGTTVVVHLVRPQYLALRQEQVIASDPKQIIWNALEDQCAADADHIASASGFLFRNLRERGARRRRRDAYVNLGLPLPPPAPTPAPSDSRSAETNPRAQRLAYLGPLSMRGGVHLFCEVLRRIYPAAPATPGAEGGAAVVSVLKRLFGAPAEAAGAAAMPPILFLSEQQPEDEIAMVRAMLGEFGVPLEFVEAPTLEERSRYYRDPSLLFVAPAPGEALDALALECVQAGGSVLISDGGGTGELLAPEGVERVLVKPHPHDFVQAINAAWEEAPRAALRPDCENLGQAWDDWHRSLPLPQQGNQNLVARMRERAYSLVHAQAGDDWLADPGKYDEKGTLLEPASLDELLAHVERSVDIRLGLVAALEAAPLFQAETEPTLVTAVIVHYERPGLVVQAIRSLATQTYPQLEVVLVDDGSKSERTVEFLERLQAPFARAGWRVVRQPNLSPGAARNRGAEAARGEHVLFVDDDNLAMPHEIEAMMQTATRTDADVVVCFRDSFTGEAPPIDPPHKFRIVSLGALQSVAPIANCFGDANALVRRNAYLKAGGYLEAHRTGKEDYEFFVRMMLAGMKFAVVPEALYWYRQLRVRRRNFHYNQMSGFLTVMAAFERHVPAGFRDVLAYARGLQFRMEQNASDVSVERLRQLIEVYDIRGDELILSFPDEAAEVARDFPLLLSLRSSDGRLTRVPLHLDGLVRSEQSVLPSTYRLGLPDGVGPSTLAQEWYEIGLELALPTGQKLTSRLRRARGVSASFQRFNGVCDQIIGGVARGWIFDELNLTWEVPLVAYVDDALLGRYVPSARRPDLVRSYPTRGQKGNVTEMRVPGRGFELEIPRQFLEPGSARTFEVRPAFTAYNLRRTPVRGFTQTMKWDKEKEAWTAVA